MTKITNDLFDPKEEDVLLKLTMPKRELRPSTVLKMKQLKEGEQKSQPAMPTQQTLPQSIPLQSAPEHQQPEEQQEQRAEIMTRERQEQEEGTPSLQQPAALQQPGFQREVYSPQFLEPPKEQAIKPHTPFSNVDMGRIEDLTRRIMYRDQAKQKQGKA